MANLNSAQRDKHQIYETYVNLYTKQRRHAKKMI